jgi:hypothetical protein
MRFPQFDERGTLTTTEVEALRSLNAAFLTARYEWQTACTMWDRLSNASDSAEHTAPTTFPFHKEAIDQLAKGVTTYEQHAALTTWRYSAAALVLGVTVLQRVVEAKPPLTATVVAQLCQEPTLGRLHEALSVPVADFLPERAHHSALPNEREETARRWAKVRDGVDNAMDLVLELAADEDATHPQSRAEVATCLLTQHCPPHTDPAYEGVLEPLLRLAEEVPFGITRIIAGY